MVWIISSKEGGKIHSCHIFLLQLYFWIFSVRLWKLMFDNTIIEIIYCAIGYSQSSSASSATRDRSEHTPEKRKEKNIKAKEHK